MPITKTPYDGYTQCEDCSGRIPPDCSCNCMVGRLRKRVDGLEMAVQRLESIVLRGEEGAP